MLANAITLARFPILLVSLVLLYQGAPPAQLVGVALVFAGLMLDTVDGIVARRREEASLLGSVLDIAADRTYELALWLSLADLDLVPVAMPLIVVARTALTDGIRAIGVGQGIAPFAQHRSALSRFLVGSPWMRTAYSAAKVATFCGLGAALAFSRFPAGSLLRDVADPMTSALRVVAWTTVALCVVRGVPVLAAAFRRHVTLRTAPPAASAPAAATPRAAPPAARPA